MKKLKILVLLILFVLNLQIVLTDQINESNLEPIEIKTNQINKDQVLLDKTETKILPKEKNASDLDDKKVETLLDDITDLSELSELQKQNILNKKSEQTKDDSKILENNSKENETKQIDEKLAQHSTSSETLKNDQLNTSTLVHSSTTESLKQADNEPVKETKSETVKINEEVETTPNTPDKPELKVEETQTTTETKSDNLDSVDTSTNTVVEENNVLNETKNEPESVNTQIVEPLKQAAQEPEIIPQVLETTKETVTEASIEEIPEKILESVTSEKTAETLEEETKTTTESAKVDYTVPIPETVVEKKSENTNANPTETITVIETAPTQTSEILSESVKASENTIESSKDEDKVLVTVQEEAKEPLLNQETSATIVTEAEAVLETSTSEPRNVEILAESTQQTEIQESQIEPIPTVYPTSTEEKKTDTNDINLPQAPTVISKESLPKRFGNKLRQLKNQENSKQNEHHHHHHNYENHDEHYELDHEHEHAHQEVIQNYTNAENRVCANLENFKQIISENFEPLYLPLVNLLPEDIQLILLNESFGGLSNASLIFILIFFCLLTSFVYLLIKLFEGKKINVNSSLNEQLILHTNTIKQLEFDLKTYATLIEDYEQKKGSQESLAEEKDARIKDLGEKLAKSIKEQEFAEKEVNKLKTNETKIIKEMNQLKSDLNSLNEVFAQQKLVYSEQIESKDAKIADLTQILEGQSAKLLNYEEQYADYYQIKELSVRLESELSESKNTIELLKNSLSIKNSAKVSEIDDYVQVEPQSEQNLESILSLAQLQMDYKNLQEKCDALEAENSEKARQIELLKENGLKREEEASQWETKIKKMEKQIKENEMQIRLLNELREKDTKQHLKALSELDMQLKKKTTDADKVGHYMEQLRVKQERIQELEVNLSRVEKQSNQERQTFEKQTHENWLNAKKFEKELKETKNELASLKEKLRQVEMGQSEINVEEQLPRPASTSSNPGGMIPPNAPGYMPFIRPPPFRFPFPVPPINPAQAAAFMQQHLEQQRMSPNQDSNQGVPRIPNMPVPPNPLLFQRYLQSHQYMQQQMSSANSSQQVSPGDLSNNSNILASTALNDFSMNNIDPANNTSHYQNDADFDFSSNSGVFNQMNQDAENYADSNANANFNV